MRRSVPIGHNPTLEDVKMAFPKDRNLWIQGSARMMEGTAMEALGVKLVDIGDEHIELTMPITDSARQPYGLLHGGVSMVLAETAASFHATWGVDLSERMPVGIEINGSHLNSAKEGSVRAVGRVIRRSRALIVHQVDIYHVESGRHLSTARVTNFYKPAKQD